MQDAEAQVIQHFAILIASHCRELQANQEIGCARRIEGPKQMIAGIDDIANALPRDIFENRFERPAVAVNVRYDRKPLHV
jgi:hypothetical protein